MKEDRKEYLKNYRLTHKEQYRKYSKKYRENNITTYERLKKENEQLRLILGNQVRIKGELLKENQQLHNKIDKAIEYLEEDDNFWIPDSYSEDKVKMIQEELLKILKDSDVDV